MKLMNSRLYVVFLTLILTACGGGSGGSGGSSGGGSSTQTGQIIDGPIKGLAYRRNGGSDVFFTNAKGEFNFLPGETIEFFIGNITLGSVLTDANTLFITPTSLAAGNSDVADNLTRFFLALDKDGNPDNGNEIALAVREAAAAYWHGGLCQLRRQ